jgi:hypothetical protein
MKAYKLSKSVKKSPFIFHLTGLMISIILVFWPHIGNSTETNNVIKQPGKIPSPNGQCSASINISEMGGFRILSIFSKTDGYQIAIDDITGIAWVNDNNLVYTVSPIYGKPGVFIYDCIRKKTKQLVNPKTINAAYPNGADYFELQDVNKQGKIFYYYAADVDSADFIIFRTKKFLRSVNLHGTEFKEK